MRRDQGPRRLTVLLAVAGLVAAPAAVLRGLCVGRSCDRPAPAQAYVPYCSLPDDTRKLIGAGFRDGRSPDVLGVTQGLDSVSTGERSWPSVQRAAADETVPLVFWGQGVAEGRRRAVTTLDSVAPTLAQIMRLDRPHPEVRSGTALEGVAAGGRPPRLVVLVVWKGVGFGELRADPSAWRQLGRITGSGSWGRARVGSLPLDPTAVLTTIGTGGLPFQHGITGRLVRNDDDKVVPAWSSTAPPSVIAALGDDLDELHGGRPLVGVVGTSPGDRGVIGRNWYLDPDADDAVVSPRPSREALAELRKGYGADKATDLLGVVDEGPLRRLELDLRRLVGAARRAAAGSVTFVLTATGHTASPGAISGRALAQRVASDVGIRGVIEDVAAGGFFLNDPVLSRKHVGEDTVVSALRAQKSAAGDPLFADAFSAASVTFGRYC